jgi:hypothetical protein
MAEYKMTAALNAAMIPLVTNFQQRTIVIPGMDNRLQAANAKSRDAEVDNNTQNFPQIMYAENIMPSDDGVMSVGYNPIEAQVGGETRFDEVFLLRDLNENIKYFSPAKGNNYVTTGAGWVSTNPLAGIPVNVETSIAYVNGVTFVLYANTALLQWDGANFTDVSASLQGVAIADIRSITGSNNYLVLLCEDLSYKWSSLVDPLDFIPDETTGAGSQIPADVRGAMVCATTVSGGVLIHCAQNTVAALYTNNSQQPWIFREVKNSGGISRRAQVSTDNNSGATYIWGTSGLQTVGLREAENMFPTVTDFLAGSIYETFNSATNLFTITRLATNLYVKVGYVASRYLVLSYGTVEGTYEYALIFDFGLKRWGKIKHQHVDVFSGYSAARQSIWLLRNTGAVNQCVMDWRTITDAGVLILGRYQLNRTNQICSQEMEVEVLDDEDSITAAILANFDGASLGHQVPMVAAANTDNYRLFQKQIEGENLTFVLKGSFHISTVLFTFTRGAAF